MRTRRDWYADIAVFLFAVVFSLVTADSVHVGEGVSRAEHIADQVAGGVGCASVFLRRRWPLQLAVVLILAGTFFHYLTGATLAVLFTVAVHREWRVTAWPAGLVLVQFVVFLVRSPQEGDDATGSALAYFALVSGAVGWGLYVRSRRALVASLEERAQRAAEAARRQAREEIAREMHDVLAHRLSLLSVHAGALEFRPDAPAEEIRRASGVIRASAHQALQELRDVIGVLRAPAAAGQAEGAAEAPEQPPPTLADVTRLVEESREAGMRVSYREDSGGAEADAAGAGRTVYRVVQEGLTNARKHAPGAEVSVMVRTGPGRGLTVEVANPLPEGPVPRQEPTVPGGGQGLIGLGERAALAGGRLEHGAEDGRFVLRVRLPGDERPLAPGEELACRP